MDLLSHRELLYLCLIFFNISFMVIYYSVVYNTVVCINTIIYFSMGGGVKASLENCDSSLWKYGSGTNPALLLP